MIIINSLFSSTLLTNNSREFIKISLTKRFTAREFNSKNLLRIPSTKVSHALDFILLKVIRIILEGILQTFETETSLCFKISYIQPDSTDFAFRISLSRD